MVGEKKQEEFGIECGSLQIDLCDMVLVLIGVWDLCSTIFEGVKSEIRCFLIFLRTKPQRFGPQNFGNLFYGNFGHQKR